LQFLLAAIFWVGRIDVAFLSPDVVLFGYSFDYVPINFVKELLVHEAHRHPYIERLAQMYLMKLRYKTFCNSNAATAWRQLAVVAFFPWLAKHRVFNEERLTEARHALDERHQERQQHVDDQNKGIQAVLHTAAAAADGVTKDIETTVIGAVKAGPGAGTVGMWRDDDNASVKEYEV